MFSLTYLFNQSTPQVPVGNIPSVVSNSNFTLPPALQWDAIYGGDAYYSGSAVVQTSDGGYLVAGKLDWKYTPDNVILIKTDSAGKMQWNKTYSYLGDVLTILQTSDNGFIMLANGNDPEQASFLLVKIDSQGYVEWKRTYTQWCTEWGTSVTSMAKTNDGGYIIAGNMQGDAVTFNGPEYWASYGFLIKTDSFGRVQWNRTYGETQRDNAFSAVIQSGDGGYAVAGTTNFNGTSDIYDLFFWLVKTDSNGNLLWDKTYGSGPATNLTGNILNNGVKGDNEAKCILQTADGGYVLAGNTFTYGAGGSDVWLVKTDSAGNMLWNRTYAGTGLITVQNGIGGNFTIGSDGTGDEFVNSLICISDGGLAFAGTTPMSAESNGDYVVSSGSLAWLVKLDASGNMQWNQTYADKPMGQNGWTAKSLIETSDGGLALSGTWELSGSVAYYYLAKTEPALPLPTPTPTQSPQPSKGFLSGENLLLFASSAVAAILLVLVAVAVLSRRKKQTSAIT
jgi:hypothetical protein